MNIKDTPFGPTSIRRWANVISGVSCLVLQHGLTARLGAESMLPTNTVSCTSTNGCKAYVRPLAPLGGVQGIELGVHETFSGGGLYTITFAVDGPILGDHLPAGAEIPCRYRFYATASSSMGNSFGGSSFSVQNSQGILSLDVPTVIFDGLAFHNYVVRSVEARGVLRFPDGLPAGTPLRLSAKVAFNVNSASSMIDWTGTVTFDSVAIPPRQFPVTFESIGDEIRLQWPLEPLTNYRVDASTDLTQWTPAEGTLSVAGATAHWTGNRQGEVRFYRVLQVSP